MKRIKVKNWKGNEYEGEWNEKFYEAQVEGDKTGIYRIYINNERIHITEEEKEKIIKEIAGNKIEEDNQRIRIIKEEFRKLDKKAKELLIEYLQDNMM